MWTAEQSNDSGNAICFYGDGGSEDVTDGLIASRPTVYTVMSLMKRISRPPRYQLEDSVPMADKISDLPGQLINCELGEH